MTSTATRQAPDFTVEWADTGPTFHSLQDWIGRRGLDYAEDLAIMFEDDDGEVVDVRDSTPPPWTFDFIVQAWGASVLVRVA